MNHKLFKQIGLRNKSQSRKKSGLTANVWLTRAALGTRREIVIAIPTSHWRFVDRAVLLQPRSC